MSDYAALEKKVIAYLEAVDAYQAKDYSNKLFDLMCFRRDELREMVAIPSEDA